MTGDSRVTANCIPFLVRVRARIIYMKSLSTGVTLSPLDGKASRNQGNRELLTCHSDLKRSKIAVYSCHPGRPAHMCPLARSSDMAVQRLVADQVCCTPE